MISALLAALLLAGPGFAQDARGKPGPLALTFKKSADARVAQRVEAFSAVLLGVPYQEFPLGEGADGVYDSDPLMRLDRADCVTFVEETLALARAGDEAGMRAELTKIRYRGGVVSYETRNHFTDADWLPNNAAAGFIRDVTAEVAGADARTAAKTISKKAWYAAKTDKDLKGPRVEALSPAQRRALVDQWRALGAALPDQPVSLPYLPISALARHAADIPSGTIVSLVRADAPDKPTLISHMGLIVRVGGALYFRHAAQGQRVLDVPLLEYFRKYDGASWPLLGLNLAAPLEPSR
jgi:hypothetical protein